MGYMDKNNLSVEEKRYYITRFHFDIVTIVVCLVIIRLIMLID